MLMIKDCPRCRGDMFVERDKYGWHKECLQCGHILDLTKIIRTGQYPLKEEKNRRLVKIA